MVNRAGRLGWTGLTLAQQFAILGGVVILAAALAVGSVVVGRIEDVVVRNTANSTALYMENIVGTLTQDLTQHETLSRRTQKSIGELLEQTALGRRVVSFKVWRKGGFVMDASNPDLIGKTLEVGDSLRAAWGGQVQAEFDDTSDPEDQAEHALGLPLLEIYTPVRNPATGEVIAVMEFYEVAETLKADIRRARAMAWASVAGVMGLIWAALFLVVLRGSRTIDAQIVALTEMSAHNLALRLQIQQASARSATLAERSLRQIGADLHDGPAQLMAFAALRLDALRGQAPDGGLKTDLAEVGEAVSGAITEIRNISRGVSVPDLDQRDMRDVLQGLADAHAARTGTDVTVAGAFATLPDLPPALRLCIYRFVQEGLNNAWQHAGGRGQELRMVLQDGRLQLSVLDSGAGPAMQPDAIAKGDAGLGLMGLKDRVESLGGRLQLLDRRSAADGKQGAELRMTIDIAVPT